MTNNIQNILTATEADVSYYYISKNGQRVAAYHEHAIIETASTIKVLILAFLLHEVEQGHTSLRALTEVHKNDIGKNGSGIIQYFYLHAPFELYNLMVMMMLISDNVATNVLIRHLGLENINAYAQRIGLDKTRLRMGFLDFSDNYRTKVSPVGESTAQEMTTLVRRLLCGELVNASHTDTAHMLLRSTHSVQESFVQRQLPIVLEKENSVKDFGSKTGWLDDADQTMRLAECGFIIDPHDREHYFSLFLSATLNGELPYSQDSANRILFAKLNRTLYDTLVGDE